MWRSPVQHVLLEPETFQLYGALYLLYSDYVSDDPGRQWGPHMMDESGSAS